VLCGEQHLGLSGDSRLVARPIALSTSGGFGLSSVRFIWARSDIHKTLEKKLADSSTRGHAPLRRLLRRQRRCVPSRCLGRRDAIISDELNHARSSTGWRLCKAQRWRYKNNDMADLERACARGRRVRRRPSRLIATDGVFSM